MGLDKVGCRIDRDYPPPRGYMCKYTDVFLLFLAEAISYKTLQIDPNTVECSGCKKKYAVLIIATHMLEMKILSIEF